MGQRQNHREIRIYSELHENEKIFHNLKNIAKELLYGKFIDAYVCVRKENSSKISELNFYLKKLEKEQIKLKINKREEIIKIRADINIIESKQMIKSMNYSWFL